MKLVAKIGTDEVIDQLMVSHQERLIELQNSYNFLIKKIRHIDKQRETAASIFWNRVESRLKEIGRDPNETLEFDRDKLEISSMNELEALAHQFARTMQIMKED